MFNIQVPRENDFDATLHITLTPGEGVNPRAYGLFKVGFTPGKKVSVTRAGGEDDTEAFEKAATAWATEKRAEIKKALA